MGFYKGLQNHTQATAILCTISVTVIVIGSSGQD